MLRPSIDPSPDVDPPFLACALAHLDALSSLLRDLPHSTLVLSATGRLLWSSDPSGPWAPSDDATRSAAGLSKALSEGPAAWFGAEHGSALLEDFATSGAPIRAPSGALAGALGLCTRADAHRPEHGLLVRQAAHAAQRELARGAPAETREAMECLRSGLRAVIDELDEGVVIADHEGQALVFNQCARQVLSFAGPLEVGVPPSRIAELFEVLALDGSPLPFQAWPTSRLLRGETFRGLELLVARRGSPERHVVGFSGSAVRIAGVDGPLMVVTVRDRTAQHGIEEERHALLETLRRQASEIEAIVSTMADGVLVEGPSGELLTLNQTAQRLLGVSPEDRALSVEERAARSNACRPDGTPVPLDRLPATRARQGETVQGVLLVLGRPGEPKRWVSASAAPLYGDDGRLAKVVVTLSDVSDLHHLQDRQDDILRMISHDLRTPLSTIIMQAQLLRRGHDDEAKIRKRADSLLTSGNRMNIMIQELVDMARLESGRVQLVPRPVELVGFLTELKERLSDTLDLSRVRFELAPDLPRALADPDRLERVLVNLLSNALKYSPPSVPVHVEASARDESVLLVVRDRGIGVEPNEQPHLFERFFRSARAGPSSEGLGLGLYITRLLVEAQGGTVGVRSTLGEGSAFEVLLPAAPQGTAGAEP